VRQRELPGPIGAVPDPVRHRRELRRRGDCGPQIGDLLEEVAGILNVTLTPGTPKVRITVVSPGRIADLYRQVVTVPPHGADVRALYFAGVTLVAIPHYSRRALGHELAHYLTDHYLKSTPRRS
jgi:hypothetical protein